VSDPAHSLALSK